jgi:hypothetical protein
MLGTYAANVVSAELPHELTYPVFRAKTRRTLPDR